MFFLSFSGKILPQTLQSSVVCISHSQLSFVLSLVFCQTLKHDVSHYWGDGLHDSGPLILFWHQRLTHTVSGPKRRKVSADYLVVWGSDISISFPFNPAESILTPPPLPTPPASLPLMSTYLIFMHEAPTGRHSQTHAARSEP